MPVVSPRLATLTALATALVLIGAPVIGGARTEITTLGSGSLIEGALSFQPGPTGLTIVGTAVNTIANVPPSFSRDQFLGFDVTFVHPPNEYAFLPEGGLVIPGGESTVMDKLSRAFGLGGPLQERIAGCRTPSTTSGRSAAST